MPSYLLTDIVTAIAPKMEQKEIGRRLGEKLNEDIVSESEAENTLETTDFYVIIPAITYMEKHKKQDYMDHYNARPVCEGFHYSSDTNSMFETIETLREKIRRYIDYSFKVK